MLTKEEFLATVTPQTPTYYRAIKKYVCSVESPELPYGIVGYAQHADKQEAVKQAIENAYVKYLEGIQREQRLANAEPYETLAVKVIKQTLKGTGYKIKTSDINLRFVQINVCIVRIAPKDLSPNYFNLRLPYPFTEAEIKQYFTDKVLPVLLRVKACEGERAQLEQKKNEYYAALAGSKIETITAQHVGLVAIKQEYPNKGSYFIVQSVSAKGGKIGVSYPDRFDGQPKDTIAYLSKDQREAAYVFITVEEKDRLLAVGAELQAKMKALKSRENESVPAFRSE